MDLRNNDGENDDPTARRWLDPGAFADRDREIWRLRADRHTIRSIAAAVGCGVASVHRALQRLAKSQRQSSPQRNALPSLESELGAELDAVLGNCQLEQSEGDFRRFSSAMHQVACDL